MIEDLYCQAFKIYAFYDYNHKKRNSTYWFFETFLELFKIIGNLE